MKLECHNCKNYSVYAVLQDVKNWPQQEKNVILGLCSLKGIVVPEFTCDDFDYS